MPRSRKISPVCAFDFHDGRANPVEDKWPGTAPAEGATFRWLHFDLSDPISETWLRAHLPPLVADSLCQKETRPRCDRLADSVIANLRAVNLNPGANTEDMVALRLWFTPTTIITSRTRRVWAFDAMRDAATQGNGPKNVGAFLVQLTSNLARRIETVSVELDDETDAFEESLLETSLTGPEGLTVTRLAVIKMRRFLLPQREALDGLLALGTDYFETPDLERMREIDNLMRRTLEELDATRDRLSAIQDQVNAAQANALGRNSYLLSVVAAIFLPLGFLTGLFGMNVAGMPGLENEFAFWGLALASLGIGVGLFLLFRLLKWL